MNLKTSFKLLAIDVDGTLLHDRETISELNRIALNAAKQKGMVSLCTGRSPGESLWIIDELDLHGNFHVLGGGSIVREPDGTEKHLSIIDPELVAEIEARLGHLKFANLSNGQWNFGTQRSAHPFSSIAAAVSGKELADELILKLKEIAKGHFVTSVAQRDNYWVQVTAPECHKGSGIKHLIDRLNISPEEVLVVGDMFNDIPMFEAVPYSVAMGNAPEEVRNKASFQTKAVHEDGLAHAIWEFFFEKS